MLRFIVTIFISIFLIQIPHLSPAQKIRFSESQETRLKLLKQENTRLEFLSTVSEIQYEERETRGGNFSYLFIDGYHRSHDYGNPQLPVYSELIEIPHDAQIKIQYLNVIEEEYSLSEYGLSFPVIPSQPPIAKSQTSIPDFVINEKIYKKNRYLNTETVKITELGFCRGVRIARLDIYPIQYNPRANKVKVLKEIHFEISFQQANLENQV